MIDYINSPANINNWTDITIKVKNIAEGDVNGDNSFNIADIVAFQKWLINPSDEPLEYWKAADFYKDNILDVFDLCLMKKISSKKQVYTTIEIKSSRLMRLLFSVKT
jgi:hypothetical protein